jgi:hypothetical protein
LGKNGTADMSSGGDITVSGQSFTINGGNADVLATSSVALSVCADRDGEMERWRDGEMERWRDR